MKKVLLVDDSSTNNLLFSDILSEHDIDSEIVYTGKEALKAMVKSDFSLILLDLAMPQMDGVTFLKHLKSNSITTPVIVMSANTSSKMVKEVMDLGAVDYLKKPVNIDLFLEKVTKVLK